MNIQRLVLFEDDKESYDGRSIIPLYYRIQGDINVNRSKKIVEIKKNSIISFDTYFNSFSIDKWKNYTVINYVNVNIDFVGKIKIEIYSAKEVNGEVKNNLIQTTELEADIRTAKMINVDKEKQEGVLYFTITALEDSVVYNGGYINNTAIMTQDVKLSVDICTFKREQYVKRNMLQFKENILNNPKSPLCGKIIINVSDNGSSLDGIVDSEELIKVRKNANLGGVGGFTRGIIETKKLQKELGLTHILIMDDDAEISTSAVEQTYMLLSYIKEEYKGHTIGGELLVLNTPYLQYEAGALWNQGEIKALQHDVDLAEFTNVIANANFDGKVEYAGWWYCCMPLKEIEDDNLPLPIFIHRDDIEYGLRIGKERFIYMNGICIWHEAFAGKMPGVLEYYDIRNLAITNAIHYPEYTKEQFKKFVVKWVMANIGKYRYKYVALNLKAVEDFCKGIDWLLKEDALALHQELFSMNYKMKPASEFVGYKNVTEKEIDLDEEKDYKLPLFRRMLHWISVNGAFLPAKKNYVHVSSPYASVYKLFRVGENMIIDANNNAMIVKRSGKEFINSFKKLRKTLKLIDREFDNASKSYRERYDELVSMEFWEKYLGI